MKEEGKDPKIGASFGIGEDSTLFIAFSDVCIGNPKTYRPGRLKSLAEHIKTIPARFVLIAGGLFDGLSIESTRKKLHKELKEVNRLTKAANTALKAAKKAEDAEAVEELEKELNGLENRQEEAEKCLSLISDDSLVEQAIHDLPIFVNSLNQTIDIQIVPSSAHDGEVGIRVSRLLPGKRKDVRLHKSNSKRIMLTQAEKTTEIVVPATKPPFFQQYASTQPDRMVRQHKMQHSLKEPDIRIVGCCGTFIHLPGRNGSCPTIVVPSLCKPKNRKFPPNQQGFCTVETGKESEPVVENWISFREWGMEYQFIRLPDGLTDEQRKVAEIITSIEMSEGIPAGRIAETYNRRYGAKKGGKGKKEMTAEKVRETLSPLLTNNGYRSDFWPGIYLDSAGHYKPDLFRMGSTIVYPPFPKEEQLIKDRLLGISCLHAGSPFLDVDFFITEAVRACLDNDIRIMVGAGDYVAGLGHAAANRGEIKLGMTLTQQDQLAGLMFARVVVDIFKKKFSQKVAECRASGNARISAKKLAGIAKDSLMTVILIPGNHDLWSLFSGVEAMSTMVSTIREQTAKGVAGAMASHGFKVSYIEIKTLVNSGLIIPSEYKQMYVPGKNYTGVTGKTLLPSGLKLGILHPQMSRAMTKSLRIQQMINMMGDCQVVIGGNFHESIVYTEHFPEDGQHLGIQIGTVLAGTTFEFGKMKLVDFGMIAAEIGSIDRRIIQTKALHINEPSRRNAIPDPREALDEYLSRYRLLPEQF